jgi:hypothetical protein
MENMSVVIFCIHSLSLCLTAAQMAILVITTQQEEMKGLASGNAEFTP